MSRSLIADLKAASGPRAVLAAPSTDHRDLKGYRFGGGDAAAIVRPKTLVALWRALEVCVAHDAAIIMQAANTGLTGGSTPFGSYDRPVIVINTMAIATIHVIANARQVICLAGATLASLEETLAPYGRDPHSVIGSSCIGASVIGGICNNSGGALIRRGPAFTEMALYATLDSERRLGLVNHLGIDLGDDPETMLKRLERGDFGSPSLTPGAERGSDTGYEARVRDIDACTPARFNADPHCLFEASGSAGKVAVFGVRLDTFPKNSLTKTFYIGTNSPAVLTDIRRQFLTADLPLPVSAEYMDRTAFEMGDRYGRDGVQAIRLFGTHRLERLFRTKDRLDSIAARLGFPGGFADRMLQRLRPLLPDPVAPRLRDFHARYGHHLILTAADTEHSQGIEGARNLLDECLASKDGAYFECDGQEAASARLHRFVIASAAIRYQMIHKDEVAGLVALDVALARNDIDWSVLPDGVPEQICHALNYGHFFCHVFHRDYLVRKGADPERLKVKLLADLDRRGAEYPAEHNVGHLYRAKPALAEFYRRLDPCNRFNPGIGMTSKAQSGSVPA